LTGASQVGIQHIPYGNPASLGEPFGLWAGEADVAGDASGGHILLDFGPSSPITAPTLPDQRRQYVYFVDGAMITGGPSDPDTFTCQIDMHMARANFALDRRYFHSLSTTTSLVAGLWSPDRSLIDHHMIRTPVFWDTQELAIGTAHIVRLVAAVNVDGNEHRFRAFGRYYDRQLLANRSFGRLVAPPPVAPLG